MQMHNFLTREFARADAEIHTQKSLHFWMQNSAKFCIFCLCQILIFCSYLILGAPKKMILAALQSVHVEQFFMSASKINTKNAAYSNKFPASMPVGNAKSVK